MWCAAGSGTGCGEHHATTRGCEGRPVPVSDHRAKWTPPPVTHLRHPAKPQGEPAAKYAVSCQLSTHAKAASKRRTQIRAYRVRKNA